MQFSSLPHPPANVFRHPPLPLHAAFPRQSSADDEPTRPGQSRRRENDDVLSLPSGVLVSLEQWRAAPLERRYFTVCSAVGLTHTLTGRSAAGLLGLDLWPVPEEIDIRAGSRGSVGTGAAVTDDFRLRGHLDRSEPRYLGGVLIVEPAEAILRAAQLSSPQGQTVLFQSLVRLVGEKAGCPLPSPDLLLRELLRPKWRCSRSRIEPTLMQVCGQVESERI